MDVPDGSLTWLGCHLGAQLRPSAKSPTRGLSMWLGHLIAWQLASQRAHHIEEARQKLQGFLLPILGSVGTSLSSHPIGQAGQAQPRFKASRIGVHLLMGDGQGHTAEEHVA